MLAAQLRFQIAAEGLLDDDAHIVGQAAAGLLKILAGHVMWVAWPFNLNILTCLPQVGPLLHRRVEFAAFNFDRLSGLVFQLSAFSMLLLFPLEWALLLPFTSLVLNGIPVFDVQLRLLLGKRLGFQTILKKRTPSGQAR